MFHLKFSKKDSDPSEVRPETLFRSLVFVKELFTDILGWVTVGIIYVLPGNVDVPGPFLGLLHVPVQFLVARCTRAATPAVHPLPLRVSRPRVVFRAQRHRRRLRPSRVRTVLPFGPTAASSTDLGAAEVPVVHQVAPREAPRLGVHPGQTQDPSAGARFRRRRVGLRCEPEPSLPQVDVCPDSDRPSPWSPHPRPSLLPDPKERGRTNHEKGRVPRKW